MSRLTVAALAAIDALMATAVGIAVVAAPLAVLWTFGFDGGADWSALWATIGTLWQFGNLTPFTVSIPVEVLTALGLPDAGQVFALSLGPVGLALITVVFGIRSGARMVRAEAWGAGLAAAAGTSSGLAALIGLSAANPVMSASPWLVLIPGLVYSAAAVCGILVTGWRHGDGGLVDRCRDLLEDRWGGWTDAVVIALRMSAFAVAAVVGIGAIALTSAIAANAWHIVALTQSAHLGVPGSVALTLAQLAYLPVLVVWSVAWLSGPGVHIGADATLSPFAADTGLLPAIPLLGILPDFAGPWLALVALAVIAAGAVAGLLGRRLLWQQSSPGAGGVPVRLVVLAVATLSTGAAMAALAAIASGSIGPGTLQTVGPNPLWLALSVAGEVCVGAAVLLFAPARGSAPGPLAPAREAEVEAPTGAPRPLAVDTARPAVPDTAGDGSADDVAEEIRRAWEQGDGGVGSGGHEPSA